MEARVRPRIQYIPALDGLRAVAVVAVLVYHGMDGWLPGGYLGVEVFFVLSGYLITALLVAEWGENGRIDLAAFWRRRAQRLLPELGALLLVTLTVTLIFLPGDAAQTRDGALAAAAYVTNWQLIFTHQSYFESLGRPPILQHLWSLAVEEQFYAAWPVVCAVSLRLMRRRGLLALTIAGAASSALTMAVLYDPAHDTSRIYYGTDTRACGLLIGAALAVALPPARAGGARPAVSRSIAVVAGALLLAFFAWLPDDSPFLYRGGFVVTALATAALVAAVLQPGAGGAAFLGSRLPRWIGTRSYGLYLWHWPVFVLLRPGYELPMDASPGFVVRMAVTFALAEASYRFAFEPVRNGAAARLLARLRGGGAARWPRLAAVAVSVAGVALGVRLIDVRSPATPAYLQVGSFHGIVGQGSSTSPNPAATTEPPPSAPVDTPPERPIEESTPGAADELLPPPTAEISEPTATPTPAVTATAMPTTVAPRPTPTPLPALPPPPAADILAVGDSVMLGAIDELANVGTIEIDAHEGRQTAEFVNLLAARASAGTVPPLVIVQAGDNGPFTRRQLDQMMASLANARQVIFVNVKVDRSWEETNNAMLADAAASYPTMTVVDWYGAAAGDPGLFWDGMHLRPEGADLYASLVAAAIRG